MMYGSWVMEHDRQFFVILYRFLLFHPSMDPENQNFEKMKKTPEDIIILQMCTINGSHICMVPDIWSATDRIFLSFWTIFLFPFTPSNNPKNQNLKNWNKQLEISSFYTGVPKIMIICYTVPEIWRVTDGIVNFHFGLFFALLPT